MWLEKQIKLTAKTRGFHLISDEINSALAEIQNYEIGTLQLFLQHTSAGLTLNENADPSVRVDFENVFNRLVPENQAYYTHTDEGPDDLPAHIKSSLVGVSLTLPISGGRLQLGTWQGIYLCEFRDFAASRRLIATINGKLYE